MPKKEEVLSKTPELEKMTQKEATSRTQGRGWRRHEKAGEGGV